MIAVIISIHGLIAIDVHISLVVIALGYGHIRYFGLGAIALFIHELKHLIIGVTFFIHFEVIHFAIVVQIKVVDRTARVEGLFEFSWAWAFLDQFTERLQIQASGLCAFIYYRDFGILQWLYRGGRA